MQSEVLAKAKATTARREVICPYCQKPAERVYGRDVYKEPRLRHLWNKRMYQCKPCEAYVGTHDNSDWVPLGRLANRELRQWKMKAHAAFDPLWKSGDMRRKEAYRWLSQALGIEWRDCHIGMFDVEMCKRVVEVMNGR